MVNLVSNFSKHLKSYLDTPGALTQTDIGRAIGKSPQYVHAIVSQKHFGTEENRRAIARVIGMKYEDMISDNFPGGSVPQGGSDFNGLHSDKVRDILRKLNWLESMGRSVTEKINDYLNGVVDGLGLFPKNSDKSSPDPDNTKNEGGGVNIEYRGLNIDD